MKKVCERLIYIFIFVAVTVVCVYLPFNTVKMILIAAVSGMAMSLSGTIFQTAFKNPIASPNILGVTTGVSIGNVVFVMVFQLMAYSYLPYRYLYCYGLATVIVLITIFSGKLVNKKGNTFSVETMIIVGMMITHLGSVFITYYQYLLAGDETGLLEIYTSFVNGDSIYTDKLSMIAFSGVMVVTIIPILLIRYRLNSVAFEDEEMKATGISNERLRTIGLALGSLMSAAAIIHCGDIGFISLVIPYMCRKNGAAEFGDVAFRSMLIGATISVVSRMAINYVKTIGIVLPANIFITLIVLPMFIVCLMKREDAFV